MCEISGKSFLSSFTHFDLQAGVSSSSIACGLRSAENSFEPERERVSHTRTPKAARVSS